MALPESHPKVAIQGNAGMKLQRRTINFSLDSGYEFIDVYTGTKSAATATQNNFIAAGYTCTNTHEGPHYTVTVQWGGDFVADRYERAVEWGQADLRSSPELLALAGDAVTLATWVADIEQDLAKNIPTGFTTPAGKALLWRLKARGVEGFEFKRYVLRLRRVRPANQASAADTADAKPSVYTTDSLFTTFKIPAAIRLILPATPDNAPADTQYGWMLRTDDVDINMAKGTSNETREWVFAPWVTQLVNFIS